MPNSTRKIPRCSNGLTYGKKCRCDFCRKQASISQNLYRARVEQRARGVKFPNDKVDPEPSRALIRKAVANGMTQREFERLTGLQRLVLQDIEKRKWIRRDTADAIRKGLSESDLRAFSRTTKMDAKWSRQMINSLSAQGWTLAHQKRIIEDNLGKSAGFLPGISRGVWKNIWYENEQLVRWLVWQIGDAQGPSKRSATHMRRMGHFPTKHYDNNGDLIVKSLPREVRQSIEGV